EAVARRLQLAPQFGEVVNLAVEDDPDRAVFVVNRLMSARQIDNAQAPHPERDAGLDEHTFVVRSAMTDDVAHAMDQIAARVREEWIRRRFRFDKACDAAHKSGSRF